MKVVKYIVVILICHFFYISHVYSQAKLKPLIGLEIDVAVNKYSDVFKLKKTNVTSDIRNGVGPLIGLAYYSSETPKIIPYLKTGIIFHSGRKMDSIVDAKSYHYTSTYKMIPLYVGTEFHFKSKPISFINAEIGFDEIFGIKNIDGFSKEKSNALSLGYSIGIGVGIFKHLLSIIAIGEKDKTRFLHGSLLFPLEIFLKK